MSSLWSDLRVGGRALWRRPGFTLVAVVTLGLGIGATTAIFGLLHRVVLSPLPYPAANRLVAVLNRAPAFGPGYPRFEQSDGLYLLYHDGSRAFVNMGAYERRTMTLTGLGEPERVVVGGATPSLLTTLGLRPALGRLFRDAEGQPGSARVLLLSYGFWRDRFGMDRSVLGRTMVLNGEAWQVVGVLPRNLSAPFEEPRLWVPLQFDRAHLSVTAFGDYTVVGRLGPGVTRAAADAELNRLLRTAPDVYPGEITQHLIDLMKLASYTRPLRDDVVGDLARTLWLLLGVVALVLLIAWVNVANLVLVRSETRHRELAIRVAVGGGRVRLFRQFLAESMIFSGLAGGLAVILAYVGLRVIPALGPTNIPRLGEVGLDGTVIGLAVLLSLGSALLFGSIPVLRWRGAVLMAGLGEGGRGGTPGRSAGRIRAALVVFQLGLSLVLLAGSGLMLRSFLRLHAVDPGFDPHGVLTLRLTIDHATAPGVTEAREYWRRLLDRVREVPGVQATGLVAELPTRQDGNQWALWVEDHPLPPGTLPGTHMMKSVSPGYVEAMGIHVLAGRAFDATDYADPDQVVMVSKALADRYWPGQNAVGKRVQIRDRENPPWRAVVGVVQTVRESGLDQEPIAAFYTLLAPGTNAAVPTGTAWDSWTMNLVARTAQPPMALVPALRQQIRSLGPDVPITDIRTMDQVVAESMARTTFTMLLIAIAAGVSLLLGAVGLYGVVAFVVSQRTREMGVRMALGARREDVRALVLRQGLRLGLLGVMLGLPAAWLATRLMRSLLFEVAPGDPVTLVAVAGVLLGITLLACYVPARRAARVDPMRALRHE